MSSLRPARTRRTRVYDCNFNLGERYYRPVVDDLDRKYSGRPQGGGGGGGADAGLGSLRSALDEAEATLGASSALRRAREASADAFEDELPARRRPASALMDDFDSIYDSRGSRGSASRGGGSEGGAEAEGGSTAASRLRAARARAQQIEEEFTSSVSSSSRSRAAGLDYSEKQVLDTVGLNNSDISKARRALADDSFSSSKRTLKVASQSEEGGSSLTKWTKLGDVDLAVGADEDFDPGAAAARARKKAKARLAEIEAELGDDFVSGAAADRARKSRARLVDLEAEMEAVADRSAARDRRVAGLRALLAESDAAGGESAASASSTGSSMRIKQVSSSVKSEKKTVTF